MPGDRQILDGRETVVVKHGPFSLMFSQIVALMLPHRSVVAGRLDGLSVAILSPTRMILKEVSRGMRGTEQDTEEIGGRGLNQRNGEGSSESDRLTGANNAPRRC